MKERRKGGEGEGEEEGEQKEKEVMEMERESERDSENEKSDNDRSDSKSESDSESESDSGSESDSDSESESEINGSGSSESDTDNDPSTGTDSEEEEEEKEQEEQLQVQAQTREQEQQTLTPRRRHHNFSSPSRPIITRSPPPSPLSSSKDHFSRRSRHTPSRYSASPSRHTPPFPSTPPLNSSPSFSFSSPQNILGRLSPRRGARRLYSGNALGAAEIEKRTSKRGGSPARRWISPLRGGGIEGRGVSPLNRNHSPQRSRPSVRIVTEGVGGGKVRGPFVGKKMGEWGGEQWELELGEEEEVGKRGKEEKEEKKKEEEDMGKKIGGEGSTLTITRGGGGQLMRGRRDLLSAPSSFCFEGRVGWGDEKKTGGGEGGGKLRQRLLTEIRSSPTREEGEGGEGEGLQRGSSLLMTTSLAQPGLMLVGKRGEEEGEKEGGGEGEREGEGDWSEEMTKRVVGVFRSPLKERRKGEGEGKRGREKDIRDPATAILMAKGRKGVGPLIKRKESGIRKKGSHLRLPGAQAEGGLGGLGGGGSILKLKVEGSKRGRGGKEKLKESVKKVKGMEEGVEEEAFVPREKELEKIEKRKKEKKEKEEVEEVEEEAETPSTTPPNRKSSKLSLFRRATNKIMDKNQHNFQKKIQKFGKNRALKRALSSIFCSFFVFFCLLLFFLIPFRFAFLSTHPYPSLLSLLDELFCDDKEGGEEEGGEYRFFLVSPFISYSISSFFSFFSSFSFPSSFPLPSNFSPTTLLSNLATLLSNLTTPSDPSTVLTPPPVYEFFSPTAPPPPSYLSSLIYSTPPSHLFFFLFDIFTYAIMVIKYFVTLGQMEEKLHTQISIKLGNTFIKSEMKKIAGKRGGRIPLEELARLLKAFPETDESTNEELLEFVSKHMDLEEDGSIDWNQVNLFLLKTQANPENLEESEHDEIVDSTLTNVLTALPLSFLFSPWFLFSQFGRIHLINREINYLRPKSMKPNFYRLIVLFFLTFYIAHWVGCLWFVVGSYEGYGVNAWVPSQELASSSLQTRYLQAFYWGFINGMAIDHTPPETNVEVLIVMTLLLVGLSMFATVIGNISSLLTDFDSGWAEWQSRMEDLDKYLESNKLPLALETRVLNHFRYKWKKGAGDDHSIASELPTSLQTDIALYLHREALQKIPLFKHTSKAFVSVLVRMMRPAVCAPGEYVVKFGDIGREMYFLRQGVCTVMNGAENVIYAVFASGSFFGEFALLFSQRRTATVKANTYCDLFTLSQEDFQSVLNDFPEFEVIIKREGLKSVITRLRIFPLITDRTLLGLPARPTKEDTDLLSNPLLDLLVSKLTPRTLPPGGTLFRAGSVPEEDGGIFFISKGIIVLEDDEMTQEGEWGEEGGQGSGEELFLLVEGMHFGHYSVIEECMRSLTARALTEAQLFVLSAEAYESVVRQFPIFNDILIDETEWDDYLD